MSIKENAYIITQAIKYRQKLKKINIPEQTIVMMLENYVNDLKNQIMVA
jgi:hypothetical protein